MSFNLQYFGVIGGEAQGKSSQRQFCYIAPKTDTIKDISLDNYFITEKNRLLLNDIIWVLDIKDTKHLHCLIVIELSLSSIKTKEIYSPTIWGNIEGDIHNQTDLIDYIHSKEIDNNLSSFKIDSNLLIIQLINYDNQIIFDKSLTIDNSIIQDSSNLIDNNAVWKELINTVNSYFVNQDNKLKFRLINNNNIVLLEQELIIDNTPINNSSNLIDSNAIYKELINTTDNTKTYFKLENNLIQLKITNNNDVILLNNTLSIDIEPINNSLNLINSNAVYQELINTDNTKTYFKYDNTDNHFKMRLTNNKDNILLDSDFLYNGATFSDFSNVISLGKATSYQTPANGYIYFHVEGLNRSGVNSGIIIITINGHQVYRYDVAGAAENLIHDGIYVKGNTIVQITTINAIANADVAFSYSN